MANNNPIGIFDSGVGGLSVARSIRDTLAGEDLLYIADSLHAPYGDKSPAFVTERACSLVEFLLARNAKAIVVACNTATVSTIQQLRQHFSVPIIGVEPGVKPAASQTQSGVVGVLATEQTVNSESFKRLVARFNGHAQIEIQACPGLAEQVEKMAVDTQETQALLHSYLSPLIAKGADTIVIGCTHYSFLVPLIRRMLGADVRVLDTHMAVAKEVARRLQQENIATSKELSSSHCFWTSDDVTGASELFSTLWGAPLRVSAL